MPLLLSLILPLPLLLQAIGADVLLPLLVWVVVHAELPHAFTAIDFAKQLSTREQATAATTCNKM